MNLFLLLMHRDSDLVPDEAWRRYAAHRCCRLLTQTWRHLGPVSVLVAYDEQLGFEPQMARWQSWFGIGVVRLDNRDELEGWTGTRRPRVA